jgi:hypothetical protein
VAIEIFVIHSLSRVSRPHTINVRAIYRRCTGRPGLHRWVALYCALLVGERIHRPSCMTCQAKIFNFVGCQACTSTQ